MEILKKVLELYDMNKTQFAEHSEIPYKTLDGWDNNGCSKQGSILLNKFIEIKELNEKHQKELEQYKDKAERFDMIQKALNYKSVDALN